MLKIKDAPQSVVSRIPPIVEGVLKGIPGAYIAGGFVRDAVRGEEPRDLDLFAGEVGSADALCSALVLCGYQIGHWTSRATTLKGPAHDGPVVQVIHAPNRVGPPGVVLGTFDFRCCQAAVYWDDGWRLFAMDGFALDTASKTLVYADPPQAATDPAQSVARAFRFVARGWTLPPEQLARMLDAYRCDPGEVKDLVVRCKLGSGGGY